MITARGRRGIVQNFLQAERFPALNAVVPMNRSMKFQHVPAARRLVQAVDVLRDDRLEPAVLFQSRQSPVRRVGNRVGIDHVMAVKVIEKFRLRHHKTMA